MACGQMSGGGFVCLGRGLPCRYDDNAEHSTDTDVGVLSEGSGMQGMICDKRQFSGGAPSSDSQNLPPPPTQTKLQTMFIVLVAEVEEIRGQPWV